MKKGLIVLLFAVLFAGFASASCDVSVNLLNQDPYPAIPGEYVKVVFQVVGTATTDCRQFYLDVAPEYPFSVESQDTKTITFGGNYISGYSSYILKAYKLVIDENALNGDQKLKIEYGYEGSDGSRADFTKEFDVNVQDTLTDFDVSIQDYDVAKKMITFGIVNVGKKNVESLTLELPKQNNIKLVGADKVIVGSLNSNDDTTASIEAVPKDGDITVRLSYNDEANVRRSLEKVVYFDNRYLVNGTATASKGTYYYLFWGLVVILAAYSVYRYYKNRKAKNNLSSRR